MKRTCGECEHITRLWLSFFCKAPRPKWTRLIDDDCTPLNEVLESTDATHCETFKLKETRTDDEQRSDI